MLHFALTYFEDLTLGQEAKISTTVTNSDVLGFAEISGDTNPVHLDADYVATTIFKQRIVQIGRAHV